MTTATRPIPHGTVSGRKHYLCNCTPCAEAGRAYARSRHRQLGYGTWQPWVEAEPVRDHIRNLMNQNATLRSIAAAAGYDHGVLGRILYGKRSAPAPKVLRTETARRILAVTLPDAGIRELAIIDGTGTLRRLRALHADGRPIARLARDLGYDPPWFGRLIHGLTPVTMRAAERIAALYERVKDLPPGDDGVAEREIRHAREHAAALGWLPVAMWDRDIDDPAADPLAPDPEVEPPPVIPPLTRAERLDRARILTVRGATAEQIAAELGITSRTVVRWRSANGWKAAGP